MILAMKHSEHPWLARILHFVEGNNLWAAADAYAAKGETDKAVGDYTAAIKYDRRNVNAYIARGALYLAGGASSKARADMALAARLDRRNAYAVLWQDIAERRAKHSPWWAGRSGSGCHRNAAVNPGRA